MWYECPQGDRQAPFGLIDAFLTEAANGYPTYGDISMTCIDSTAARGFAIGAEWLDMFATKVEDPSTPEDVIAGIVFLKDISC